jgi:hypothetical protein
LVKIYKIDKKAKYTLDRDFSLFNTCGKLCGYWGNPCKSRLL